MHPCVCTDIGQQDGGEMLELVLVGLQHRINALRPDADSGYDSRCFVPTAINTTTISWWGWWLIALHQSPRRHCYMTEQRPMLSKATEALLFRMYMYMYRRGFPFWVINLTSMILCASLH